MGTFTKQITLRGATTNGAEPPHVVLDALVDTGALFSSAPADVLRGLGVKVVRTMPVRFADGAVRDVPIGEVDAEIDGHRMPILCFFGAQDVPALLGAHALEAFLLTVHPIEQKLVPREAFLMYSKCCVSDGRPTPALGAPPRRRG
jgi:predicted aspartyl protease